MTEKYELLKLTDSLEKNTSELKEFVCKTTRITQ